MVSDKIETNAVGGKTARACDSCIHKRARWYCAADDAFLCQACDTSVHSANPLARRHERVRLKTASFKLSDEASVENSAPSWHRGFARRARTPRHRTHKPKCEEHIRNPFLDLVPEDENSNEENEEQLLYRVPVFDLPNSEPADSNGSESNAMLVDFGQEIDNLHGFLPSDMDLAEFAANVESFLGRGLENECFGMESLGLIDCEGKDSVGSGKVKFEAEERVGIDMIREPFELRYDYDSSPATCWEEEEKVAAMMKKSGDDKKKKKLLRLDYEAVINEWKNEGTSSWFTGDRPEVNPCDRWPDFMGSCGPCGTEVYRSGVSRHRTMGDGEREARVSRYREKRRTRLFSKKIRYEVRKLNAEKRPRIKGRFVKRSSFAPPTECG